MEKDVSGTALPPLFLPEYIARCLSLSKHLAVKGKQAITLWIAKQKTEPSTTQTYCHLGKIKLYMFKLLSDYRYMQLKHS